MSISDMKHTLGKAFPSLWGTRLVTTECMKSTAHGDRFFQLSPTFLLKGESVFPGIADLKLWARHEFPEFGNHGTGRVVKRKKARADETAAKKARATTAPLPGASSGSGSTPRPKAQPAGPTSTDPHKGGHGPGSGKGVGTPAIPPTGQIGTIPVPSQAPSAAAPSPANPHKGDALKGWGRGGRKGGPYGSWHGSGQNVHPTNWSAYKAGGAAPIGANPSDGKPTKGSRKGGQGRGA